MTLRSKTDTETRGAEQAISNAAGGVENLPNQINSVADVNSADVRAGADAVMRNPAATNQLARGGISSSSMMYEGYEDSEAASAAAAASGEDDAIADGGVDVADIIP